MIKYENFNSFVSELNNKFFKFYDDNLANKLCRRYSTIMLITLSTALSIFQILGTPLECWCPVEYTKSRCKYATTYCYISNFFIPNSTYPLSDDTMRNQQILYYQWVPFIFLLQAFLFYFPSLVWKAFQRKSPYDLDSYVKTLKEYKGYEADSAEVFYVTHHIEQSLSVMKHYTNRGILKRFFYSFLSLDFFSSDSYLSFCYLFVKLVYLSIVWLQLNLMNEWFRDENSKDHSLFSTVSWNMVDRFPRTTLCYFEVLSLQDPQPHWIQCTLPINVYLEKIYFLLFYWMWFLLVVIGIDAIKTLFFILSPLGYLSERLDNHANLGPFEGYLSNDCLLVFKLVESNTSRLKIRAVINQLYRISQK